MTKVSWRTAAWEVVAGFRATVLHATRDSKSTTRWWNAGFLLWMCAQWRRTGSARGPSGAPATCPRFPSLGHRVPILQVESQSFPVWQRSCPWRPLDVFKPSQVHARISKVVWSVGSWPRPCVWELYKYGWWVPPWSSVLMGMFGIPRHAHTRIHAW